MNHYEAKLEARRQRLQNAANNASAESDRRYNTARTMGSAIPFGQPILVGHHSEKRDRNYRGRINSNYEKAFQLADKAKHLASKAASVGTGGISQEDPEAVQKLKAELAELEAKQAKFHAINKAHKQFLKDPATLDQADLSDAEKAMIRAYVPPYSWEPHPVPPFRFQNLGANIRRIKGRIEQVANIQAQAEVEVEQEFGAVKYLEEDFRVQLVFPGKPDDKVRAELKGHGFKWSPTRGAWVRALSEAARYHGKRIAQANAE